MRWTTKEKIKKTEWFKSFAWRPIKTEEGITVLFEFVYKRYKVHMSGGSYVYSIKGKQ